MKKYDTIKKDEYKTKDMACDVAFFSTIAILFILWCFVAITAFTDNYNEFEAEDLISLNREANDIYVRSSFKIQITYTNEIEYIKKTGSAAVYKYEEGKYYLLTNKHVIDSELNDEIKNKEDYRALIIDYSDFAYPLTLEKVSETDDLAIISFESEKKYQVLEFQSDTKIKKNTQAINISNPLARHNAVEYGYYKGIYKDFLSFDMACYQGSSGSAVLNNKFEIIGLACESVSFITTDGDEFSYLLAIPLEKLQEFIK